MKVAMAIVLPLAFAGAVYGLTLQEPPKATAQDLRPLLEDLRWMESYRWHHETVFKHGTAKEFMEKNPWCDIDTCIPRHRAEARDTRAKWLKEHGDR